VLLVQQDEGCGGDGADAPGAEADSAQCLEGGLEQRVAAFAGARVAACSRLTVRWSSVSGVCEVFLIGVVSAARSPS
jgi:hypothetical protein